MFFNYVKIYFSEYIVSSVICVCKVKSVYFSSNQTSECQQSPKPTSTSISNYERIYRNAL